MNPPNGSTYQHIFFCVSCVSGGSQQKPKSTRSFVPFNIQFHWELRKPFCTLAACGIHKWTVKRIKFITILVALYTFELSTIPHMKEEGKELLLHWNSRNYPPKKKERNKRTKKKSTTRRTSCDTNFSYLLSFNGLLRNMLKMFWTAFRLKASDRDEISQRWALTEWGSNSREELEKSPNMAKRGLGNETQKEAQVHRFHALIVSFVLPPRDLMLLRRQCQHAKVKVHTMELTAAHETLSRKVSVHVQHIFAYCTKLRHSPKMWRKRKNCFHWSS